MALEAFEAIPEAYREGIEGLVVSREAQLHPEIDGVYTLGYCDTESFPSDWIGPDTTRSTIVLYYGSFRAMARGDPEFDWEAEIHETVEHEVKHHLESLADEDALGDVDYAMDEGFKRAEGGAWDPWYYQHGDRPGKDLYAVEDQIFLERVVDGRHFEALERIEFEWDGERYSIPRPEELGDVHYVWIEGDIELPQAGLELVLVRRRSWWEDVKRVVGSSRPRVVESRAVAEPVVNEGGTG